MIYKGLLLDDPRPPATTQQIAMLESALGCSLPPDYAAFLTATNGAVLNYEVTIHF